MTHPSTHPLPLTWSRRVCDGGGEDWDPWAVTQSQAHCPLIILIKLHNILERELLQLGRRWSSDVPREAFSGAVDHPGSFTMRHAQASLVLQAQKTHQVRTKSRSISQGQAHRNQVQEQILPWPWHWEMPPSRGPEQYALSLSMDTGSQISYKQLPRECGIRRRWPLGGIHGGAQGTLIPVCLLNLSSRDLTFYEKPPWTGPRMPCPCSQNTVSPQHRLHCPTSSLSRWRACLPCYIHAPVRYRVPYSYGVPFACHTQGVRKDLPKEWKIQIFVPGLPPYWAGPAWICQPPILSFLVCRLGSPFFLFPKPDTNCCEFGSY